jgi:MYXO-CTERM domain-containing protein
MPRVTQVGPGALAAIGLLATLAAARPAAASYPCSTYVVPTLVELQPSDAAATSVIIHGAFIQLTSDTTVTYGDPRCGLMHFVCAAGQESMCQMQWKELRDAVSGTPSFCEGFGSWNVLSVATIHDEGTALGTPDTWDLGMGIAQGVYVDNKCPPARQLVCPPSFGDGGTVPDAAPDVAPPPDAALVEDAAPAMDVAPPRDAPPIEDASADHETGADSGADTPPMLATRSGWCSVAAPTPASLPVAAIVLAALVLGRRRRRDAGR